MTDLTKRARELADDIKAQDEMGWIADANALAAADMLRSLADEVEQLTNDRDFWKGKAKRQTEYLDLREKECERLRAVNYVPAQAQMAERQDVDRLAADNERLRKLVAQLCAEIDSLPYRG